MGVSSAQTLQLESVQVLPPVRSVASQMSSESSVNNRTQDDYGALVFGTLMFSLSLIITESVMISMMLSLGITVPDTTRMHYQCFGAKLFRIQYSRS